jgi:hypothetical protein
VPQAVLDALDMNRKHVESGNANLNSQDIVKGFGRRNVIL